MKNLNRSAFTLIELIFVIVIIGILSAVAVPKFASMKQNAEAASVVKVASDAFASIPAAFVNLSDLQDTNVTSLAQIVEINGKGWNVAGTTATYRDPSNGGGTVATITLTPATRNATLAFTCANFADTQTRSKCWKQVNGAENNDTTPTAADGNVSF